jgi:hypothetical protein
VGVMSCSETEALCRKNNLSFVELLQPFSKLTTDVTVKDPEGVNNSVANLNLTFQARILSVFQFFKCFILISVF